jgi:hypothetical protein
MGTLTKATTDPEVVSYLEQNGHATILIFCVADDGHLYLNRDLSGPPDPNWRDLGTSPSGSPATGTPAGVTYIDQSGRQIRVFVRSEDGHLNVAWLQGDNWLIQDQGTPPGTRVAGDGWAAPVAVTYFFEQRIQHVYCFVPGEDNQLYLNKWDGQWSWVPLGAPRPLFDPFPALRAVTYFDEQNFPQVLVFATTFSGDLWYTQETLGWSWIPLGRPDPSLGLDNLAAVGYLDLNTPLGAPRTRLRVFGVVHGELYVRWWDGVGDWTWSSQNAPTELFIQTGFGEHRPVGAVHYIHQTRSRLRDFLTDVIYVFALDNKGNIIINWWNGKNWNWGEQGNPGVSLVGRPCPAGFYEYFDPNRPPQERVFAAVRGNDGNLYVKYWNERISAWEWFPLDSPKLPAHPRRRG